MLKETLHSTEIDNFLITRYAITIVVRDGYYQPEFSKKKFNFFENGSF